MHPYYVQQFFNALRVQAEKDSTARETTPSFKRGRRQHKEQ